MSAKKDKITYIPVGELVPDKYQLLPPWPEQELAALVSEVKECREIREPLQVDEGKAVLDGHNRLYAAREAGLEEVPCIVRVGLSEAQKLKVVYGQLHKRSLDYHARQKLLEEALKRFHDRTDNFVANMVACSDKTVAAARARLIATRDIPDHDALIGMDNKSYPVERHHPPDPEPSQQGRQTGQTAPAQPARPVQPAKPTRKRAASVKHAIEHAGGRITRQSRSTAVLRGDEVLHSFLAGLGFGETDEIGPVLLLAGYDEGKATAALAEGAAVLILPRQQNSEQPK